MDHISYHMAGQPPSSPIPRTKLQLVSVDFLVEYVNERKLTLTVEHNKTIQSFIKAIGTLRAQSNISETIDVSVYSSNLPPNIFTEITRIPGNFESAVINGKSSLGTLQRILVKKGDTAYPFEKIARMIDDVMSAATEEDTKRKIKTYAQTAIKPLDEWAAHTYAKYRVDLTPVYGMIAIYVSVSAFLSLTSYVSGGLPKDLMAFLGSLIIACAAIYFFNKSRQRKLALIASQATSADK